MALIENEKQWEKYINEELDVDDDRGTGINFMDGSISFFINSWNPPVYPFIFISGQFTQGHTFDHQQFHVIYLTDFKPPK